MISGSKEQAFSHKLPEQWEVEAGLITPTCHWDIINSLGLAAKIGNKSEWQLVPSRSQTTPSNLQTHHTPTVCWITPELHVQEGSCYEDSWYTQLALSPDAW